MGVGAWKTLAYSVIDANLLSLVFYTYAEWQYARIFMGIILLYVV